MKKSAYILFCGMVAVLLIGCKATNQSSKNASLEEAANLPANSAEQTANVPKIPVKDISISIEDAAAGINEQPNLTAARDLVLDIPQDIESISEFTLQYSARQPNKDFYEDFLAMFSYLFPDREVDDEYLLYYGKNSRVEFDDDGNLIQDLNKVKDKYNDIIDGREDVLYFLYDESWYDTLPCKNPVCAEFTSPICNDLSRFNKGKTVALLGNESGLEAFSPYYHCSIIDEYPPDSTESYPLLDKEIPICEAVSFFESYINNLPFPKEEAAFDMRVEEVDVMEVDKDIYGYGFITTKVYNNIPFDYTRASASLGDSLEYDLVVGEGFMVESDDVDIVYGIYRSHTVHDEVVYDEMISLPTAAKIIGSSLSDKVTFEVCKAELFYCPEFVKEKGADVEDYIQPTAAAWKLTLFNPNDNLTYVCYVDAKDGGNFRYRIPNEAG